MELPPALLYWVHLRRILGQKTHVDPRGLGEFFDSRRGEIRSVIQHHDQVLTELLLYGPEKMDRYLGVEIAFTAIEVGLAGFGQCTQKFRRRPLFRDFPDGTFSVFEPAVAEIRLEPAPDLIEHQDSRVVIPSSQFV